MCTEFLCRCLSSPDPRFKHSMAPTLGRRMKESVPSRGSQPVGRQSLEDDQPSLRVPVQLPLYLVFPCLLAPSNISLYIERCICLWWFLLGSELHVSRLLCFVHSNTASGHKGSLNSRCSVGTCKMNALAMMELSPTGD